MDRRIHLILVAAVGACVLGCSRPGPARAPRQVTIAEDSAASTVFTSPELAQIGSRDEAWETSRNDVALNVQPAAGSWLDDSWDSGTAPDFYRVRRVTISRTPETVTFFLPQTRYGGSRGRGW